MLNGHIGELSNSSTKHVQHTAEVRHIAESFARSMGFIQGICIAMEFQLFNVAEELRFMQDEFRE